MVEVDDSRVVAFDDLRWEGNDDSPPTFAVECKGGGTIGTNAHIEFRNCWFGVYPWTSQGTYKGDVQRCVGFTGPNANNDQFLFDSCIFSDPTAGALYIPNPQSIWGVVRNCLFDKAPIGVYTEASVQLIGPQFNRCDIDIEVASTARVFVDTLWSENSGMLARLGRASHLYVDGGVVRLDDITDYIVDMYHDNGNGSGTQTLRFTDVRFDGLDSNAGSPVIRFGPNGNLNLFFLMVERATGTGGSLPPSVLSLVNSMSGSSRGVVEWTGFASGLKQFRNELAASGAGTRTTVDTSVWDSPVAEL